MDTREFMGKVHIAYKGKGAQKAPAEGSVKYNQYLSIANDMLRNWGEDPNYNWNSLFSEEVLTWTGAPVAVPTGYVKLVDKVIIKNSTGKYELYPVAVNQRNEVKDGVYVVGFLPKMLTFTTPERIQPSFIGADMIVPCGIAPPELLNDASPVVCDNLSWLILATAAELARNDPAKDDQAERIFGLAGIEYRKMQDAARVIIHGQPNTVPRRNTGFAIGGSI